MIITVTLNPSLDRTLDVGALSRGDVIRATTARLQPGGKGVNVSRALAANSVPSRAIVTCGGDEGAQLAALLRAEAVHLLTVPITGRTRSNITLVEPDGTVTKINEPGPRLSPDEFTAVTDAVARLCGTADWVVICGAAPPGVSTEAFGRLCRDLLAHGSRVAVDTSGPALRAAAHAGVTLVKPNRAELAEAVGRPLPDTEQVQAAAETVRDWGAGTVLASLGADGAVLAGPDGIRCGTTVPVTRTGVGAGDAMLAGYLSADTTGRDRFTEALAWGTAAAALPGSTMPSAPDIHRDDITIHRVLETTSPTAAPSHPVTSRE